MRACSRSIINLKFRKSPLYVVVGIMDIEDLRKFLVISQDCNLQNASKKLNLTPSALSKVIKRLENEFNQQMFKREGRNLKLNQHGIQLQSLAMNLVHESDQLISKFMGSKIKQTVKIAGPSILLQQFLPALSSLFPSEQFEIHAETVFEGEAITAINKGLADIALVTNVAMNHQSNLTSIGLCNTEFHLYGNVNHKVFREHKNGVLDKSELLAYDFVVPIVSPFCGEERGLSSDGWKDDLLPRNVRYKVDDLFTLTKFIDQGLALAYLPEFMQKNNMRKIELTEPVLNTSESIQLAYKPSLAFGWLNQFIARLEIEKPHW